MKQLTVHIYCVLTEKKMSHSGAQLVNAFEAVLADFSITEKVGENMI